MDNSQNVFITVYTCSYPTEIAVIKGRLQAEDIECYVQDELIIGANPLYSNAVGGVKLQVKIEDYTKVRAILMDTEIVREEMDSNLNSDKPINSSGKNKCPNCGSYEISKPKFSSSAIAICILLLGFPIPWMSKTIHCFDCGGDFNVNKRRPT